MASFQFFVIKGKKSLTSIYGRFKPNSDIDIKARTGLFTEFSEWSKKKQKINQNNQNAITAQETNDNLKMIERFVLDQFNSDYSKGATINKNWLENTFKLALNQPIDDRDNEKYYLKDFIEAYIKKSSDKINPKTGNKLSIRRIQKYDDTLTKIKLYQLNVTKSNTKFSHIDFDYYLGFIKFLDEIMALAPNTIGGHVSNLKFFLKKAENNGFLVHSAYKKGEFIEPANDTLDTYLNEDEIERIYNHKFKSERLDNVRDWLVISVWTGLRISDFLKLKYDENIVQRGKTKFILKKNFKTSIMTVIPLHPNVQSILDKRQGAFPNKITDQKFNDYVKEVCEQVGIDEIIEGEKLCPIEIKFVNLNGKEERKRVFRNVKGKYPKFELISGHIGRRSFATNHYGDMDNYTLMNITGHKTEKQFLEYVKRTPLEHAEKLMEMWKDKYQKA